MNTRDDRRPDLEDPRVVEALDEYLAALESGRAIDRQAFLARYADVAEALAECLEGMDALHQSSSARYGVTNGVSAAADWRPGTVLGDFRIVREVGRGGMGVVYEAEQISLERRIALKVLPFALTLDPRQLQRFKNEARAAAQLHHQHIVPVYYVGSERGVHFYAMQYIDGQSLAEVIRELRQLSSIGDSLVPPTASSPTLGRPSETMASTYSADPRAFYTAVARLGAKAAEALVHAHEYGVVHRDIKPANLMIDTQGHLWVTDFGLAQFQADTGLTQTGDLLGTLRYMSPEQAGRNRVLLDHRTDIYSLGSTLYELLTLRPPFDGTDRQTLLDQILNDEPRPLRTLRKSVPAELETIVLKCLEKEADRRYATAQELAEDLRRFLGHEPIRARPATPAQRLRKWARRHPAVVWAGGILCVLTVAGSLVTAGLVQREQANTLLAYDQERQRSREAEERFRLARAELDEMFKLCEEELADKPYLDNLRRQMLEKFLVYYEKLIEQRQDDLAAQAELTATRARVLQILDDLAVLQGAGQYPLLKEPAVLDDLRLRPEQRERVRELTGAVDRRWGESFREFGRLSSEERRDRFLRQARRTAADVEKVLTADQRRRLRQIDLQRRGDRAFEDPEVTAALKLTAGQKEQIRAIRDRMSFGGLGHRGGPPGPPKASEPNLSVIDQIEEKVLTAEQRQAWHELTGEPFKGPILHRGGPRPGLRTDRR
jgi:serine/threonine protein kinase